MLATLSALAGLLLLLLNSQACSCKDLYASSNFIKSFFDVDIKLTRAIREITSHADGLTEVLRAGGFLEEVTKPLCEPPCDSDDVVFHPVNQLLVIRKFNKVWPKFSRMMKPLMSEDSGLWGSLFTSGRLVESRYLTPLLSDIKVLAVTELDYIRARQSIIRLMDMYRIPASEVQRGDIAGRPALRSLLPQEVLEMGEACKKIGDRCRTKQFADVHAHLVAEEQLGAPMNIQPELQELCESESCVIGTGSGQCVSGRDLELYTQYRRLCVEPELWTNHSGSCFLSRPHPIFFLAPLQVELINPDIRARVVHNALTDADIATLERFAPEQRRARLASAETLLETRVGTTSWLDDQSPEVAAVTAKAEIIAHRDASTADSWQIGNYGIGGHYYAHRDYFEPDVLPQQWFSDDDHTWGNRLTTLMAYLGDVAEGGNTVFPLLRLAVRPARGAAVVWDNMLLSGEVDPRSLHGGCPVLLGNKKIANKWFHYNGQFLKAPCQLDHSI